MGTSSNTSLRDELTCAAALRINILLTLDVHISVLNPSHYLFVGTHVGTETIDLGADEILLYELQSIFTSDSLELLLGVMARVDFHTAFGATEWDLSDSELESHQSS